MELKINDIVELLQVEEKTIKKWIKERKLPAYKVNNQYLFNKAEVNEWILKNNVKVSSKILELTHSKEPVRLAALLKAGGVFYGLKGTLPKEVIKNAVDLIPLPPELPKEKILSSLLEREEMMPTAIGRGVAIPHPRTPVITDTLSESVSLCFLHEPVEYGAMDNEPVAVIFIVLSASSKRHLEILSKIMFLCREEGFAGILKNKKSPAEIYAYVEAREIAWQKGKSNG